MKKLFGMIALCALVVMGCQKKAEPVMPGAMKTYTDGSRSFSIQYPENWKARTQTGDRITVYSSSNDMDRFNALFNGKAEIPGIGGARVTLLALTHKGQTLDELVSDARIFDPVVYQKDQKLMIDGKEAVKLSFSFPLEDGNFNGETYISLTDSTTATMLEFLTFSDLMSVYRPTFDQMLKSVKIAQPAKVIERKVDTVVRDSTAHRPSATTKSFVGNGYSLSIPDNFKSQNAKVANTLDSKKILNGPVDCFIQVDVFDASKQNNLEKIVEQNKAAYKGASASATTLGGSKAYVMSYAPSANIQGRVYFAVKGNKMFRITTSWYAPEKEYYMPAFDKAVQSLKFD
jgi:hypothetical protein